MLPGPSLQYLKRALLLAIRVLLVASTINIAIMLDPNKQFNARLFTLFIKEFKEIGFRVTHINQTCICKVLLYLDQISMMLKPYIIFLFFNGHLIGRSGVFSLFRGRSIACGVQYTQSPKAVLRASRLVRSANKGPVFAHWPGSCQ